jgi:hypothetical protein
MFSLGLRNFDRFFPSKCTTKGKRASSSTQQPLRATTRPLVSKQINHPTKHNTGQPKAIEESILYGAGNLTMKKKIVYGLPIPLAHAAPIDNNDTPLPKIVHGKDFS